jgi:hypothetical protein
VSESNKQRLFDVIFPSLLNAFFVPLGFLFLSGFIEMPLFARLISSGLVFGLLTFLNLLCLIDLLTGKSILISENPNPIREASGKE